MEQATYEVEAQVERTHWWFRGRRRILDGLLRRLSPGLPPGARILDVGCGTGANGPVLRRFGATVIGIDASPVPLGLSTGRSHTARLRGDAGALPFADGSFDLVVALDVLEHLDDDRAAARELRRVVRPGGAVVVFVPALRILWGLQDEISHHRRRYGREELSGVLRDAGLELQRLSFFNTLLFPPILGARLLMRLRPPRGLRSENEIGGPFTNTLLGAVFALEAPLLRRVDLPVGVSLLCVARRPA